MRKIIFIGDSHASFFSGYNHIQPVYPEQSINRYNISGIRLGPVLSYSLHKSNTTNKGREKLFKILEEHNPLDCIVGLAFGEIDCRCHIVKNAEKANITIEESVERCCSKYEEVIEEINYLGYKIIVWNVIPTSPQSLSNEEFPHYGTDIEREKITQLFNNYIKNKICKGNVYFLDIYDSLISNNRRIEHFFFDGVHLSQSAMFHVAIRVNHIEKVFSWYELTVIWIRSKIYKYQYYINKVKYKVVSLASILKSRYSFIKN